MKAVPEVQGKPWTRWIGLAVLFVYGGLAALDIVPSGKEGIITSVIVAAFTWLAPSPSVRTTPVLLAVLALPLLAGCSGWRLGWGNIARETDTYRVAAVVMPDSSADVAHVQATYQRKDGTVPDVAAVVSRPSPDTAQVDVTVRGLAGKTMTPIPAPAKAARVVKPATVARTTAGSCRGGVCPLPVVPLGQVDKELWQ